MDLQILSEGNMSEQRRYDKPENEAQAANRHAHLPGVPKKTLHSERNQLEGSDRLMKERENEYQAGRRTKTAIVASHAVTRSTL